MCIEFELLYHHVYDTIGQTGIQKGLKVGFGNGLTYAAFFLTYALGFWYSGKLIADSISDGCTSNCPNGGE